MPVAAVLFDLGNTLAAYYRREEFGPILERSIDKVLAELAQREVRTVDRRTALTRAAAANRERADFRFAPLLERLVAIFELAPDTAEAVGQRLCATFLQPILATGRVYDDALPTLTALRQRGYATAIVSNTPWGSPPELWRAELGRLGLAASVDTVVFCGDVGWRKPSPRVFEHVASRLGIACAQCMFVGDEPEWDVAGSSAVGMRPVLIDRDGRHSQHMGERIRGLDELLARVTSPSE
jgi:HAD superfamily hydrolase (TIGR01509 family)